jgi:hypothetical protein
MTTHSGIAERKNLVADFEIPDVFEDAYSVSKYPSCTKKTTDGFPTKSRTLGQK